MEGLEGLEWLDCYCARNLDKTDITIQLEEEN
jgi:hypothetical protein